MNNDSFVKMICKDVSKTIQHISSCPVATHTGTVILALLK
jgi:hypothetical protein